MTESWLAQLLLISVLGLHAFAQQPEPRLVDERVATAVTVLDDVGARASDAALLLFAAPWSGDVGGEIDMVRAVTGKGGRVVVRLLPERHYAAVASRSVEQGFAAACVEPGPLVAGTARSLKLGKVAPIEPRFLAGLDRWRELGPLRVDVSPLPEGSFFFPMDEHLALPVLRMCVRDQHGAPIWEGDVADALANGIPAPQPVTVRVRRRGGKTTEGAEIWQRSPARLRDVRMLAAPARHNVWRLIGKTDAKGEATVEVALRMLDNRVVEPLVLEARAKGWGPSQSGVLTNGLTFVDHVVKVAAVDHVLEFQLTPLRSFSVLPAAKYRVVVFGKGMANDVATPEGPFELHTSAKGTARWPLRWRRSYTRLVRLEREGHPPIWSGVAEGPGPRVVTIDANAVTVEVRDRFGNPCRDARVGIMTKHDQSGSPSYLVPLRLDAAARCELQLNTGQPWLLVSRQGDDLGWHYVAAHADESKRVVLQMKPVPRATVQVLTESGAPAAAGLELGVGGSRVSRPATDEERFVSYLQCAFDREFESRVVLDRAGKFSVRLMPTMSFDVGLVMFGSGRAGKGVMVSGELTEITLSDR